MALTYRPLAICEKKDIISRYIFLEHGYRYRIKRRYYGDKRQGGRVNFKCMLGGIVALGVLSSAALADAEAEDAALAERLAPVGKLCLQGQTCQRAVAQPEPDASLPEEPESENIAAQYDGEALYASAGCGACHTAGIAGAPATGDNAAWTARLAQGTDTLYANAIKGIGAMPPKGGRFNFSDDEIRAAVDYMIEEVE